MYEMTIKNMVLAMSNDTNQTQFSNLSAQEQNLLYGLFGKLKGRNSEVITVSFEEAKVLSKRKNLSISQMTEFLIEFSEKTKKFDYSKLEKKENKRAIYSSMVLFVTFIVDPDIQEFKIQLNPSFEYFFNSLDRNFTMVNYLNIYEKKTKYSKRLVSLLSQYRSTGIYRVTKEELYYFLDVPTSYDDRTIYSRIIKKSIDELKDDFPNLKIERVKRGRTLISFVFTFDSIREAQIENKSKGRKKTKSKEKEISGVNNLIIENIDELRFKRDVLNEELTPEELIAIELSDL